MENFTLQSDQYSLWLRIKKELALLTLLIAILLFFVGLNVVYFTATFLMYFLLLLLKRNRIITMVQFDNQNQKIIIQYYYLIFFKGQDEIPYQKLNHKISMKRFGFGAATQTLELLKGKTLIAEIRKEGKWSWRAEKIELMNQKLNEIRLAKVD